ncbi:craniofacial development protein 1-like isoform X2 [Oscarella lobularis]|uniref:craniofacial development protein 1-like isoform X2 n=1 Tax=Oscarella lobularis TaxID=121494 RepID=UPI003313812F
MSSSESESDEDYVPEGVVSDDEEDSGDEAPDEGQSRKRARIEERDAKEKNETRRAGDPKQDENQDAEDEAKKKQQRAHDLWSSFKKDVGETAVAAKPHPPPPTVPPQRETKRRFADESQSTAPIESTKTYDFAGEKVIVEDAKPSPSKGGRQSGSGLANLVKGLGKTTKISTLEKSKLDWKSFTTQEGLAEELKLHNKDGYLERQAFLERTDHRQYEREKEIRLKQIGKRTN